MPDSNILNDPHRKTAHGFHRRTPCHPQGAPAAEGPAFPSVATSSSLAAARDDDLVELRIPHSAFRIPHLALLALSGGATLVAALAPLFKSAWVYFLFQAVCHQNLERALWIAGAPMAVCARCFGVYAGALAALLASLPTRRRALLAALLLLVADVASEWLGARPAWAAGRVATGFLAGAAAAPFLTQSMAEALEQ